MKTIFTICSNNYLAHAATLFQSLKKYSPETHFILFLCDEKNGGVDYEKIADETIVLREIEPAFETLASKYNIVELNTCLKPLAFEFLFSKKEFEEVLYFDPDIKIFSSVDFLFDELDNNSILLTPHICSPIPFDEKTPQENHFLNFGIYNLGFIGLKNNSESKKLLNWWKNHTYHRGKVDVYKGIFVDQLPVNFVPLFFENIKILKHPGLNMAPWNLHERALTKDDGRCLVNDHNPLVFYHFSSFRVNQMELPLAQYNRFALEDFPLLKEIYIQYRDELIANGIHDFEKIIYAYKDSREKAIRSKRTNKWKSKFLFKK